MHTVTTSCTALIDAPPSAVYPLFADYRAGHPRILPKLYFSGLEILSGGYGAGTVFRTTVTVMGVQTHYHMAVSEPVPGHILVEEDATLGVRTSFTEEPAAGSTQSRVTIATTWPPKPGLLGWIERVTTAGFMRKIYAAQFDLVRQQVCAPSLRGSFA
jgi:hypothetical protein